MLKTFPNSNYCSGSTTTSGSSVNFDEFQLSTSKIGYNDKMTSPPVLLNTISDFSTYITDNFDLSLLPPTSLTSNNKPETEFDYFSEHDDKSNIPQILIHSSNNDNDNFTEYRTTVKEEKYLLSPCYYSASSPDSYSNLSSPVSYCGSTSSPSSSLTNIFDEVQIFNDIFHPKEAVQNIPMLNNSSTETKATSGTDHQLLRQVLKDMSFQKKHNIKTMDIDLGELQEENSKRVQGDSNQINNSNDETIELEPMLNLALQQMKEDVKRTCITLSISPDMKQWSHENTQEWLKWALTQLGLSAIPIPGKLGNLTGKQLASLNEMDVITAVANFELGSTIFAQLEIWKAASQDATFEQQTISQSQLQLQLQETNFQNNWFSLTPPQSPVTKPILTNNSSNDTTSKMQFIFNVTTTMMPNSSNQSDEINNQCANTTAAIQHKTATNIQKKIMKRRKSNLPIINDILTVKITGPPQPSTTSTTSLPSNRQQNSHIHLWQFLKELLDAPQTYGNCIRWIEQGNGVFKIEDSLGVAQLWGKRKNRPAMNYDKLSRSIRQYYKKGIMKKTEKSQRLVYQFCPPYCT